MTPEAKAVLDWWFETLPAEKRFVRDDSIDAEIAARFGDLHVRLTQRVPEDWQGNAEAMLAAIIVLDQFSRNLFRDGARAFANDAGALALTENAIARGWDADLTQEQRQFLYMPLMHSERLADVERCEALMAAAAIEGGTEFARRHAATIRRFGRYPARNAALGRATTREEADFLRDNPSGF